MTQPRQLKRGDLVRYKNPVGKEYGPDMWNGHIGVVSMVDHDTDPHQYVRIIMNYLGDEVRPFPIIWVERSWLTYVPPRGR